MKSSRLPFLFIVIVLVSNTQCSNLQKNENLPHLVTNHAQNCHQQINAILASLQQSYRSIITPLQLYHFSLQAIQSPNCQGILRSFMNTYFSKPGQSTNLENAEMAQDALPQSSILEYQAQIIPSDQMEANQNNKKQEHLMKKSEDAGHSTNFKRMLRNLQTQQINENENEETNTNQKTTVTSQTTSEKDKDGKTIASQSSTNTKNTITTTADSGYKFGFNSATVSTPQIDLRNLGFSIPTTGGIFTQTITNKSTSNRTKTTTDSSTVQQNTRSSNGTTKQSVTTTKTVNKNNNQTNKNDQTTLTNKSPEKPLGFSNVANKTVSLKTAYNKQFTGIEFYHPIPDEFLFREVFMFRGRATRNWPASRELPINIIFRRKQNPQTFSCSQILEPGIKQFNIPCQIQKTGNFYLSAFAGSGGQATPTIRTVSPSIDRKILQTKKPNPVTGLGYEFNDNELTFKWDSRHPITKISITQDRNIKSYEFSNFLNEFKVDLKDLANFKPNQKATISVQEASSGSGSSLKRNSEFSDESSFDFMALQSQFAEHDEDELKIKQLPWIIPKNTKIKIEGKSTTKLKNEILLVNPEGEIEEHKILNNPRVSELPPNIPINTQITLNKNGNYIIQINTNKGKAVLNRPFYVYTPSENNGLPGLPIVPDFQALKKDVKNIQEILREQPKTPTQRQNLVLDLINEKRKQFGVDPVALDPKLNKLAQDYANDMVRRGFSGHVNPEGEGPGDRARKVGINTPIGENLAMNPNITDSNHRLARSAIHLRVMIDQEWTRVGIGIAQMPSGAFRIVHEYSSKDLNQQPVSEAVLEKIRRQIVRDIVMSHQNIEKENIKLSYTLKSWQRSENGRTLPDALKAQGFNSYSYSTMKTSYRENLAEEINEQKKFKDKSGKRKEVGVGIKMIENGRVEIVTVFI